MRTWGWAAHAGQSMPVVGTEHTTHRAAPKYRATETVEARPGGGSWPAKRPSATTRWDMVLYHAETRAPASEKARSICQLRNRVSCI